MTDFDLPSANEARTYIWLKSQPQDDIERIYAAARNRLAAASQPESVLPAAVQGELREYMRQNCPYRDAGLYRDVFGFFALNAIENLKYASIQEAIDANARIDMLSVQGKHFDLYQ